MPATGLLLLLLAAADGCQVSVWADIFSGRTASFTDGEYSYTRFTQYMDNDAISSLEVTGQGCVAMLYGGPNFDDWQAAFPVGKYDLNAAVAKGLHDNEVSSMRVGYGQSTGKCRDNALWVDQYNHPDARSQLHSPFVKPM